MLAIKVWLDWRQQLSLHIKPSSFRGGTTTAAFLKRSIAQCILQVFKIQIFFNLFAFFRFSHFIVFGKALENCWSILFISILCSKSQNNSATTFLCFSKNKDKSGKSKNRKNEINNWIWKYVIMLQGGLWEKGHHFCPIVVESFRCTFWGLWN